MFKIIDTVDEKLRWPVVVELPVDGGNTRKFTFTGVFRRLSEDQKEQFGKDVGNDAMSSDTNWVESFIERVMQIMVGWEDVCDHDGKSVEFSAEALRRAIRAPSGVAVMKGINRAITEYETGTKAKN
jgi:hypothetical protein